MAVAEKLSTQLRLVFYDGEDSSTGKPVYKSKSFNNVKTEASAEQLLIVAEAFAELQERPVSSIERNDSSAIQEN